MNWLLSVYIAMTIFGVGVTVIDLIGALGGQSSEEGDSGEGEPGQIDGEGADEIDSGSFDELEADIGGVESTGDAEGVDDAGPEIEDGQGDEPDAEGEEIGEEPVEGGHARGSIVGHDGVRRGRKNPIFRFFSVLRSVVYFSMGMGPVGWFSLARGESYGSSLIWGLPFINLLWTE